MLRGPGLVLGPALELERVLERVLELGLAPGQELAQELARVQVPEPGWVRHSQQQPTH